MRVLAIGAHPDDLEILCGGALFRFKEQGAKIFSCVLTDGSAGHRLIPADKLRQIRKREAESAARFLGAKLFWMGVKDEFLFDDEHTRLKLIEFIRQAKPDLVFCHSEKDYHQDHQAAFKLCFAASFIAGLKNVKTHSEALFKTPFLYEMDTLTGIGFEPEEYVDISEAFKYKLKMLSKHKSQLKWLKDHDKIDIADLIYSQAHFRGYQSGVELAESFRLVRGWGRVPVKRVLP